LHIVEEMAKDKFSAYWLGSERVIPDKGDLSGYWIEISSDKDFLICSPSYTYIRDPIRRLRGLFVVTRKLRLIDMGKFVKLNICREIGNDWAWSAQAVPAPIHAPPSPPLAVGRTMPQRLGRFEEEIQGVRQDVRSLRGLLERSMIDLGRFFTWMISCMTQLMEANGCRHSMKPFKGVTQRSLRGVPDAGPTVPAPPQPSRSNSVTPDPFIPYIFTSIYTFIISIMMYLTLKQGTLSILRAELRRESVYKSVEDEEKSNLKTLL
nr:hypothetical protein [Tanacetum cinerariifolium]